MQGLQHIPVNKIMLIDIDGTICDDIPNEYSYMFADAEPHPGAARHCNQWYSKGNQIHFFTAREEKDRHVTEQWLEKHGFKYHSLIMNKPRIKDGQEYVWIDNRPVRAITYKGGWSHLVSRVTNILTFIH